MTKTKDQGCQTNPPVKKEDVEVQVSITEKINPRAQTRDGTGRHYMNWHEICNQPLCSSDTDGNRETRGESRPSVNQGLGSSFDQLFYQQSSSSKEKIKSHQEEEMASVFEENEDTPIVN